jgi:AraC-like DNA-binding protein
MCRRIDVNRSRRPAPSLPPGPAILRSAPAVSDHDIAAVQRFARELQIFAGRLGDADPRHLIALLEPVLDAVPSAPTPSSIWIVRALLVNVLHRIDAHVGRPLSLSGMDLLWRADTKHTMGDIVREHVSDLDHSMPTCTLPANCGDSRIDRALLYMREHCSRPSLAVDEVCAFVRLSRWHFSRLFTRSLGMTFREAIRRLRMERATILLNEHLLSIKEIAARLGFVHPTEFDRQFKQSFKMTPTEWRTRRYAHVTAAQRGAAH